MLELFVIIGICIVIADIVFDFIPASWDDSRSKKWGRRK
jgi:hypothetical protein